MERDEKLASASEDARQIAGKYEANAYGFANLSVVIENVYVKNQNVATIYDRQSQSREKLRRK